MSEYQYYEWQSIDRPLTAEEQDAVNSLSSHMDTVTSTQAIVTYSWGDFKHDPRKVLLRYFDDMLYLTNWGTRQLMFRFLKARSSRRPSGLIAGRKFSALTWRAIITSWISCSTMKTRIWNGWKAKALSAN